MTASVHAIKWVIVDDKTDYFSVDAVDPDPAKWTGNVGAAFSEECNDTGCHSVWVQGGTMNTQQNGLGGCAHGTQICPDAIVVTKAAWADNVKANTRMLIQKSDPNANFVDAEVNYRLLADGASIWQPAVDLYTNIHLTFVGLMRSFRLSFDGTQVQNLEDYRYDSKEWFEIRVVVDRTAGLTSVQVYASKLRGCLINYSGSSSLNTGTHQVRAAYLMLHNTATFTDYHIAEEPSPTGGDDGGLCGGGGGSVPHGSLITMADGRGVPVQNLESGDQILMFDVYTGSSLTVTIASIRQVTVDNTLTIHTEYGMPLRVDANPNLRFYVWTDTGPVLKPVTEFQPGDLIYNYDHGEWVPITEVHVTYGGNHEFYDLLTDPYLNADGQLLSFIANGYADPCGLGGCKQR